MNKNQENKNQGNQENPSKIKVQTTGYKNTEIGVIPEEWEVKRMKDICWVNQGLQIPIEQRYSKPIENSKVYITIQYLGNGKDAEYIKDYSKSVCCEKEDILMTRTGNTGIVVSDVQGVFHNNFFKINFDKRQVDRVYLLYFFRDTKTQKVILEKAGTSTIPDLNHNDFYSIKIGVPKSLPEQTAIATVLSDTDKLLQTLQKKIAKKRLIKKGTMQVLLKPKEGWAVKTLGEVGKTFGGLSGKSKKDFQDGKYPYIPFMNIMTNPIIDKSYFDYVNLSKGESQNKCEKGDLFFNGSSETPEEVGLCSVLLENVSHLYLNSFCFGFRLFNQNEINGLFLSYFFRSPIGRKHMSLLAQGATRYNLSKANFLKLKVKLPLFEEQKKIATILSDMDTEIENLEKQLAKYKQVKQGLMQNLLTGKIRLV